MQKIIEATNKKLAKKSIPDAPEGFEIISDPDYVVQKEDSYHLTRWQSPIIHPIAGSTFINHTIKNCLAGYLKGSKFGFDYKDLIVYRKLPDKPRFKTDKPYPFGY